MPSTTSRGHRPRSPTTAPARCSRRERRSPTLTSVTSPPIAGSPSSPRPKASRTNGMIERFFGFVATSFFSDRERGDASRAQRQVQVVARRGRQHAHVRGHHHPTVHGTRAGTSPPVPVRRPPYPLEVVVTRKVDRYSLVCWDGARYSVAPGNVGAEVAVITRPGSDAVEIRRGVHVIGSHKRVPAGQISNRGCLMSEAGFEGPRHRGVVSSTCSDVTADPREGPWPRSGRPW
jgi:hypothetical protein